MRVSPIIFVIGIVFLNIRFCQGQKESNWWYFYRNAGVQFEQGFPLPDTNANDSVWQNGAATAPDFASIADSNGGLLFYASYTGVFNRQHRTMKNGILNDSAYVGNVSQAEQSALIIPRPRHPNHYFFFYGRTANNFGVPYPDGIVGGFFYNQIDMSLDGGLGDVVDTVKNVYLIDSTDEKVTATPHANGVDYWLMVRRTGQGQFCAFLVTEDGVAKTPVVSEIGNIGSVSGEFEGALRFNHAGDKLAHHFGHPFNGSTIEYYDFDNATGVVSNLRVIQTAFIGGLGLEFSPDDSKLYFGGPFQYDVTEPTGAAIQASEQYLGTFNTAMSGLQLGLDGKLYGNAFAGINNTFYLSVIHNPNEAGIAAGYQDSAVYLEGKIGGVNLPQFLSSYFVLNFYADTVCVGEAVDFTMNFSFIDSAFWDFGDPASGAANTSTALAPSHTYNDTGVYTVMLIAQNGIKTDTVIKNVYVKAPPEIDIGPDVGICLTTQDTVRLASGLGSKRDRQGVYAWSVNDSMQSTDSTLFVDSVMLSFSEPGSENGRSVTLSFTNECGSDEDIVLIYPAYPLSISVPPTYESCTDTILMEAVIDSVTAPTALYWYNEIDTTPPIVIAPPTTAVPVRALLSQQTNTDNEREFPVVYATENACGVVIDSTVLRFIPVPDGLLPEDSIHCATDSFFLFHNQTPLVTYQWNDGTADSALLVSESGTYTLRSSSECGVLEDEYIVDFISLPNNFLTSDTAVCFDDGFPVTIKPNVSLSLRPEGGMVEDYIWSTSATTSEITVTEPGTYALTITAGQCTKTDSTALVVRDDCADRCTPLPPNIISPNADGINDQFIVSIECAYERYELLVFNRWGQKVHHYFATDNSVRWDATTAGAPVTEGTYYYIIHLQKPGEDAVEYYGSLTVVR